MVNTLVRELDFTFPHFYFLLKDMGYPAGLGVGLWVRVRVWVWVWVTAITTSC